MAIAVALDCWAAYVLRTGCRKKWPQSMDSLRITYTCTRAGGCKGACRVRRAEAQRSASFLAWALGVRVGVYT